MKHLLHSRLLWILNTVVVSVGLYTAYRYNIYIAEVRELVESGCGCGVSTEAYNMYLMDNLFKIWGIKLDALSIYGFLILLVVSLICLFTRYSIFKLIYTILISTATVLVAYLIYLSYINGYFCIYCSIMHVTIVSSFIISIVHLRSVILNKV